LISDDKKHLRFPASKPESLFPNPSKGPKLMSNPNYDSVPNSFNNGASAIQFQQPKMNQVNKIANTYPPERMENTYT